MKTTIKDYILENIEKVHDYVAIFLIIVLCIIIVYIYEILMKFNIWTRTCNDKQKLLNNNFVNLVNAVDGFGLIWKLNIIQKKIKISHNLLLETIWTIVPIFVVIEMIYPSLTLISNEEIDDNGSVYTVSVIGNQWYWNYEVHTNFALVKYVSNLILLEPFDKTHIEYTSLLTTNESLPIPLGTKISLYITSNDVIHSWSIPGLGIKVDAIPGRINLKTVIASKLGLYSGMCSEICGVEHGFMPISMQVLTFFSWFNKLNGDKK